MPAILWRCNALLSKGRYRQSLSSSLFAGNFLK